MVLHVYSHTCPTLPCIVAWFIVQTKIGPIPRGLTYLKEIWKSNFRQYGKMEKQSTTFHYTTLHTPLHYTALHYITLNCTTLRYTPQTTTTNTTTAAATLHYAALH